MKYAQVLAIFAFLPFAMGQQPSPPPKKSPQQEQSTPEKKKATPQKKAATTKKPAASTGRATGPQAAIGGRAAAPSAYTRIGTAAFVPPVTFAGDLSGNTSTQMVIGLLGHALPTLSGPGYVHWNGSDWVLDTPSGGGTGGSMTWPLTPGIAVCAGTPCSAWSTSFNNTGTNPIPATYLPTTITSNTSGNAGSASILNTNGTSGQVWSMLTGTTQGWATPTGGGGGSGTITSGSQYQIPYYTLSPNGITLGSSGIFKNDLSSNTLSYTGAGGVNFDHNLFVGGTLQVAGPWIVQTMIPTTAMGSAQLGQSAIGISSSGDFYISNNHTTTGVQSGTAGKICTANNNACGTGSGTGMTWPGGSQAGVAIYSGNSSWGVSGASPYVYNATNTIPASYIPILNQNTTGTAALASAFDHTPALCSLGAYSRGITATGASTACIAAWPGAPLSNAEVGVPEYNGTNSYAWAAQVYNANRPFPASYIPTSLPATNAGTSTNMSTNGTSGQVWSMLTGTTQGWAAGGGGSMTWPPFVSGGIPSLGTTSNTWGPTFTTTPAASRIPIAFINPPLPTNNTGFPHITNNNWDTQMTIVSSGAGPSANGVATVGGVLTTVGQQPYEMALTYNGTLTPSTVLLRKPTSVAYTIPAGCTNSMVTLGTMPSALITFVMYKNGVQFGSFSFASTSTLTGVFLCNTATSFAVGVDVLTIVAPATPLGAADFGGSIYATR